MQWIRPQKALYGRLPIGINIYRGPSFIVEKGDYLYFTNGTGTLFCVDRLSGEVLWNVTGMDLIHPIYGDNMIFCTGNWGNGLYAFDAQNGTVKWQNTQFFIYNNPYFYNGKLFMGGTDPENFICLLNAADGSIVWKKKTDLIYGGPIVTGKEIYMLEAFINPGGSHHIVVFDADSGVLKRTMFFKADPQRQIGKLSVITSLDNYLNTNW